ISAKRDLIKNVRFCEYMGAGSEIPIGDEAIFLSDIMTNYTISHADVNICYHPHESSGSCKESKFSYARGMTIRKVFGFYYGSLIVIPFFIFRAKLFRYSPKQFIDYIKGFLKVK
ncbi:hypothetical protein, partial [Vibrio harveyi]|uniref:hypothetical protein n=1 Tax=Vibrio harveyi TaxID=669 RepID=UPI000A77D802